MGYRQELILTNLDAFIVSTLLAPVLLLDVCNGDESFRDEARDYLLCIVGRAIVYDNPAKVLTRLGENGSCTARQ